MITSPQNENIRHFRSIISSRKSRKKSGQFIIEGIRLIEEAVEAGWLPEKVLFSEDINQRGRSLIDHLPIPKENILEVKSSLLADLSDTETSQGILMMIKDKTPVVPHSLDFVLILDEIRDPGNLGTLLRTGDAAGVQAIFLTPGTTDPFSPKVLRSGMGAHFHLPIFPLDWESILLILDKISSIPFELILSDTKQGISLWHLDLRQPVAIIIGSEAFGASISAGKYATRRCTIPMNGRSESLNAAIAGGILLFEVVRQREKISG